ncbi:Psilocybin biosynthesis decarboxylase [Hyphodiscus hymeniophilus]|uniref:Psilocybin biosynthesis decarboxylase n=1 Tax=Hyphodiscus hymeniophilus TaxID=353542 RepID=A0A9P6VHM2_9HELO|nr:Psilocybin biosynthesis decarboxylase [Hyphodiscus hymeniophilus]
MVSKVFKGIPAPGSSLGHWLPEDRAIIQKWLAEKLKIYDQRSNDDEEVTRDPSIVAMQDYVNGHPPLKTLSKGMFIEIPPAYVNDPTGKPQVRDFDTMLGLVDMILKEGPSWYHIDTPKTAMGLIGFPINAILDWPMGTGQGYLFFMNAGVNNKWQDILNTWGANLKLETLESKKCLNQKDGWLSKDALDMLAAKGNNDKTHHSFQQLFECDPSKEYFGFSSWDAFFTRKFNPGIRPTAYPDDEPSVNSADALRVIVNACESAPLQFIQNVKLHDFYWIKNQPYSLANMLENDTLTDQFVGGSVYQAFLSALSYHCWHAPVSGKVVGIKLVPGNYYAENLGQGFTGPDGPDPNAPNNSQPFISAVAARGIIFIKADNPVIGLMAIVFVGMAEVSSCEFVVKEGDHITKGDLIGMFHFGGSSHCMVFRKETNIQPEYFVDLRPPWKDVSHNFAVRDALILLPPTEQ